MTTYKEKRTTPRVEIPQAKVYYKKDQGFELFKKLDGPLPLRDLGMGGACFEVSSGLEWGDLFYGDPLYLEIIMPDRKKVHVKGHIRWISGIQNSDSSYIGMEFRPFGEGIRSNSRRSQKRIEQFTNAYN